MNVTTSDYSVGQKMILVRDRHDPIVVAIDRLTKTRIIVRHPDAPNDPKRQLAFKASAWGPMKMRRHEIVGSYITRRFAQANLYDFSDEAMAVLLKNRVEAVRLAQERRQAEEEHQQKIADKHARELAEVKELCDGQLQTAAKLATRMPDGTRIYVLECPVHADYFERKKGWQIVVVKCEDVEGQDWEKFRKWREEHPEEEISEQEEEAGRRKCMVKWVEYHIARIHGSSISFCSCSGNKATSDEEALWEALHSAYTSW